MARIDRHMTSLQKSANSFISCPLGRVADMVGGQAVNTDSLQGEFAT
jgi:hypothetical protein